MYLSSSPFTTLYYSNVCSFGLLICPLFTMSRCFVSELPVGHRALRHPRGPRLVWNRALRHSRDRDLRHLGEPFDVGSLKSEPHAILAGAFLGAILRDYLIYRCPRAEFRLPIAFLDEIKEIVLCSQHDNNSFHNQKNRSGFLTILSRF